MRLLEASKNRIFFYKEDFTHIFSSHSLSKSDLIKGLLEISMWIQNLDLDISLATLNLEEPRSGIGNTSSTPHSTVECASCSIFHDEYEDEDVDY